MLTKKQIENTKLAYSVMAGIPSERVYLNSFRSGANGLSDKKFTERSCGSTGCIAGWLAAHPEFKAQGLRWFAGEDWVRLVGDKGGAPANAALKLFGTTNMFNGGHHWNMSDKQLALQRLRQHLFDNGAISDQRNAELIAYEDKLA